MSSAARSFTPIDMNEVQEVERAVKEDAERRERNRSAVRRFEMHRREAIEHGWEIEEE